ncbi:MAG: FAD-dependent oxidoreductase [Bacteroidota bacterium]
MKHVAVIGAGMAGAGAAWRLHRAGHRVTVYEKEAFAGGRTHTHRGDGFHVNTGAGFFTNFYPRLRRLIRELDLESEVIENPKVVTLATPDRRYDYHLDSVRSFWGIPWLRLSDKARMLRHTAGLTLKKRSLDLADVRTLAARDTQSIRENALRKVGARNYAYLIRTAVEPYWYFSCAEASVALADALQAHAVGARFFSLHSGMDRVVGRMLRDLPIHYATAVASVTHSDDKSVRVQPVHGEAQDYAAVVVATPAAAARNLLRAGNQLPGRAQTFLASQRYAANINAYFYLPERLLADLAPQTSPCGGYDDELAAIATHGSRIDPQRHPAKGILGVWLTDAASRSRLAMAEADLAEFLWRRVRKYYPEFPPERPELAHLTRRAEAIPLHAPGRFRDAARIWEEQRGPVVLAGDYLGTATMEGALQTGYRAADILLEQWK